jgi:hypothetical protein
MHSRLRNFLALCALTVVGLGIYLYSISQRQPTAIVTAEHAAARVEPAATEAAHSEPPAAETTQEESPPSAPPASAANAEPEVRTIFFKHTGLDAKYGFLAQITTGAPGQIKLADTLRCEAVHVSGGKGICLTADRGVLTTYAAVLFDADTLKVTASLPLNGVPSRCRVSLDGKLAALTVFVSGHGYASLDFSTQTLLIDTASGKVLADLEQFKVTRNGALTKAEDFNFWGVTFMPDAKQFYATLSTAGQHYLVRGDVHAKTAEVIHDNVECPSLSPSGTRIAYKKRAIVDKLVTWQLHVLDLASKQDTALGERRSVDDQLEWLDERTVLYSVPSKEAASTDVWSVAVESRREPKLFLSNAYSPAVFRNPPGTNRQP